MSVNEVKPGYYRHFKGNNYEVVGIAKYSEDIAKEFVIYKALYKGDFPEGQLWVRPKEMFCEYVTRDGKTFPRFEYIGEHLK